MLKKGCFFVSIVYKKIIGEYVKVYLRNIICFNDSFFKIVFIIWVVIWEKLRIRDVEIIDISYVMCMIGNEDMNCLFFDFCVIYDMWR